MNDTVLITGGSGFIGTHLSRALIERGDKVVNFDLFPRGRELAWLAREIEPQISFEQGDASKLTQLIGVMRRHKPNKIVHIAASIDMASLDRYPAQVHEQMVGGTVNVLEATRLLGGIERMVYFSSIGVLPTKQYEPIDCNHPTLMAAEGSASGIYGAGKIASEAFCWAYADLFDLDIVQLRPSAAYGFFTKNTIFLNEMLEGALRGEPVSIPHGRYLARDYTHVADIAGIAIAALHTPASRLQHRCFYAASGMNPLINAGQIADMVRDMVPGAAIEVGETLSPMLERYEVKMRGVLDVAPVESQLEYRIRYRDLRDGLIEYADAYCGYLTAQGIQPAKRAW